MTEPTSNLSPLLAKLVHYYEVRMVALSEYSDRVWNRFNWMLTLEVAIFGLFVTQLVRNQGRTTIKAPPAGRAVPHWRG
jgi:hypothetical protein